MDGVPSRQNDDLRVEQERFDSALKVREARRDHLEQVTARGARSGAADDRWATSALHLQHVQQLDAMAEPDSAVAFGRMDVELAPGAGVETVYLGHDKIDAPELLVINWRAPAAEAYYLATPSDPRGVRMRRSFTTDGTTLTAFSDVVFSAALDPRHDGAVQSATSRAVTTPDLSDALLESLQRDRTGSMQAIVESIQSEQYRLVEVPATRTLVVQGGAGTGKTAVALHRVSMLLYRERHRLTASDVLVVGPSRRFTEYVRTVLPSLGDAGVAHADVQALAPTRLDVEVVDPHDVARLKGDARMAEVLGVALRQCVLVLDDAATTVRVGGFLDYVEIDAGEVRRQVESLLGESGGSLALRRNRFVAWLQNTAGAALTRREQGRPPRPGVVRRPRVLKVEEALAAAATVWLIDVDAASILRHLWSVPGVLESAAEGILTASEVALLAHRRAPSPAQVRWSADDVALLDELAAQLGGPAHRFQHVVVDEAQDLSAMQWRSVTRRAGRGALTVVGDIAQSTGPHARDGWEDVVEALGGEADVTLGELTIGYRVPRQVAALAARLLPVAAPAVPRARAVREGPSMPFQIGVAADAVEPRALDEAARIHRAGGLVGVMAAPEQAVRLQALLARRSDVDRDRINVLTPHEAKGLEFDTVVLVEPDGEFAQLPRPERHLYIAATRTTKNLVVVHHRGWALAGLPAARTAY